MLHVVGIKHGDSHLGPKVTNDFLQLDSSRSNVSAEETKASDVILESQYIMS